MTPEAIPSDTGFTGETANDRLKRSWDSFCDLLEATLR